MATLIKICGITRLEDARFASAVGADYIGFVQKPNDPRQADAATIREIIEWVVGPKPVGVFENASAAHVLGMCSEVGFALAQLDGDEPPYAAEAIQAKGIPVIKTIHVRRTAPLEQLRNLFLPYAGSADFFRLDASESNLIGNLGENVIWLQVSKLASEFNLFVSGNFTLENIEHVVSTVRPFALDVSESVEEAPGVKDFGKLGDLFDAWYALTPETT